MKNIKNSTALNFLALGLTVLLIEAGCKATVSPIFRGSQPSLMDELAPSDILSRYDTSNIAGIIAPRKELYSIITQTIPRNLRTNWDGTQSWGQANFIDSTGAPEDVLVCLFNKQWQRLPSPNGGASGGYAYNGEDLPVYTDGSTPNIVDVEGLSGTFGSDYDTLTFGTMPSITNIVRGQNISRDSNITLNWTGTSSDFVSIIVSCWDSTGTNDTIGKGFSVGGYFNNTGSATLSINKTQLVLGLADIELRKYEPKFITLSSGKRVCVVCETCEDITVHIVG